MRGLLEKQLLLKANCGVFEDIGIFLFTMEQNKPRGKLWEGGKQKLDKGGKNKNSVWLECRRRLITE